MTKDEILKQWYLLSQKEQSRYKNFETYYIVMIAPKDLRLDLEIKLKPLPPYILDYKINRDRPKLN